MSGRRYGKAENGRAVRCGRRLSGGNELWYAFLYGNFTAEELPEAVRFAHSHGVRVHAAVNTMPRNNEAAQLPEYLRSLDAAGVDALILADLGVFTMAGKFAPNCERHVSTQQSIGNYACAQAWWRPRCAARRPRAGAFPCGDP